jgi:alkanesulfonate monooxygenase SsuD/methylene tetrahydromethanopterin reductase-like flavin-dependent oxidoreductase (luciferase family)
MKLGMFMMPLHPPGRNAWETLAEDREAILLADRLGFEEAFVGEHVTDLAENVTSSLIFLASVAHATTAISLGTGTINMPNAHPATIAAQVAMIDHMLEGRFILGISPGGLMSDAEVFGNYEKDRNAIFLEAIDMVLEIWKRDGPYDLRGEHFAISTARTMIPEIGQGTILKPYQSPHPPIVVTAVAPHSKGVGEAAKRGWTPISANFLLPEWVATHWPRYAEGREAAGAAADPADWRIAKCIFVADDEVTAQRYGKSPEGPYHFYFKQLVRKLVTAGGRANLFKLDQNEPDAAITPERVTDELVIAGTVASVVEQLLAFRETTGDFGTLLYACMDWKDEALGRRSMELLAEQVMPRLNAAIGARVRAGRASTPSS